MPPFRKHLLLVLLPFLHSLPDGPGQQRLEASPPETSFINAPLPYTALANAVFWMASPGGTDTESYECSLNGGRFSPCANPFTLAGLDDGPHTLFARARNSAGQVDDTPAFHTWTVDTLPPAITLTPSAPFSLPAENLTRSTTAIFSVHLDTVEASSPVHECRLDGSEFTPCPNPVTLTGLADGPHTLSVRTTDAAGNVTPRPAVRTWTVDTMAPDTEIISGPSRDDSQEEAFFTVGSPDADTVGYECSLDNLEFTNCPDPLTFSNLSEGSHYFRIRARDALGNVDETPAIWVWGSAPEFPTKKESYYGLSCASGAAPTPFWMWLLPALGLHLRRIRSHRQPPRTPRSSHALLLSVFCLLAPRASATPPASLFVPSASTGGASTMEPPASRLTVHLRLETELQLLRILPALGVEYASKLDDRQPSPQLGIALTALLQPRPRLGLRAEGRLYPVGLHSGLGPLHPYVLLGATAFPEEEVLSGRAGLGFHLRLGSFLLFTDAAYEHFLNPAPKHQPNAVLLSLGVGWSPVSSRR